MSPRLVADIHPYEQIQKVAVYRDKNKNDTYEMKTDNIVQDIYELYTKEQACQFTLLGSKKFDKRLQAELEKLIPNIKVAILYNKKERKGNGVFT